MRAGTIRQRLHYGREFGEGARTFARPPREVGFTALLVCFGYYVGTQLGFALTFQPHAVSTLWPPNAILLAGLLVTAPRHWWLILLAAFPPHVLGQIQSEVPTVQIFAWFFSNCTEALIGAGAIRYVLKTRIRFSTFRELSVFLLCGALLAPFLSSFIDIGLVKLIGWGQGEFWSLWRMRFFSNVLASLTLVPFLLVWKQNSEAAPRPSSNGAEFVVVIAAVVAVTATVLRADYVPGALTAIMPFLIWAAVRLGVRGTSVSLLAISIMIIWSAIHGAGPFATGSPSDSARMVQLFLIVISVPLLLLAAVIEERANTERALRRSEERVAKAFRCGPGAMAIVRLADGQLLDVNERWQELFGFKRDEAVGHTTPSLGIFPNEREREDFADIIRTERHIRDLPLEVYNKSGAALQVLLTVEQLDLEGVACAISMIRDVTDLRRMEREAEEQRGHMMQLTRAAVLGQLSGALAHELNQPLTAILCNAQAAQRYMLNDAFDRDELRAILKDIVEDDKRAGEVIRRLRALLGRGETQFDSIDINLMVQETLALVRGDLVAKQVTVQTYFDKALPFVLGDRVQLQQILLNLVVNAAEAMSEKASYTRVLTLTTATNDAGQVYLAAADTGCGIPAALLEKMFEPFCTTKKQGLGLGLSISRRIIEAHSGALWAENNATGGATLHIVLPAITTNKEIAS